MGGFGFVVGPTLAGRLVAIDIRYVVAVHLLLASPDVTTPNDISRGSSMKDMATDTRHEVRVRERQTMEGRQFL